MLSRMSLAFKLTATLTLGMALVLVGYGFFAVRREMELFDKTQRQFGEVLGFELASRVAVGWRQFGKDAAIEFLQGVEPRGKDVRVRWVSRQILSRDRATTGLSSADTRTLDEDGYVTVSHQGQDGSVSFHTYVAISVDDPEAGAVEVVESIRDRNQYVLESVGRLAGTLAGLIALNALLAAFLSAWLVSRPISRLVAMSKRIGTGDFSTPAETRSKDEIGSLAAAMTDMSEQLLAARNKAETEERARTVAEKGLQHAERLVTVGKLAAGVAHEIGTPLNVISGRAKALTRDPTNVEKVTHNAGIIREQTDRITDIVRNLLDFARRQGGKQSATDIPRLARQTIDLLKTTIKKQNGVAIAVEAGDGALSAMADPTQIQQVLTNLTINAIQAMPNGGNITVKIDNQRVTPPADTGRPEGDYICLAVRDEGCGIEPDNLPHIFEPFFTTKDVGEGTGLGLSVVHGIVQDHGGFINVESTVGKGSAFFVYLPKAST